MRYGTVFTPRSHCPAHLEGKRADVVWALYLFQYPHSLMNGQNVSYGRSSGCHWPK